MFFRHRPLLGGLILGAVLRLVALPLGGTGDVAIWKVWSFGAASDLTGVYGVGGDPPERGLLRWQNNEMVVDYPPFAIYELAAVGHLYRWWDPLFQDSRTLTVLVKLPSLIAELLLVTLVLTWGRRRFGDQTAVWTALALWLNPAMILNGPVLGYLDAVMAVPAAIAVMAAVAGSAWVTGVFTAIAVLTKAQAIFVTPAIAGLLYWRSPAQRWRLPAAAALASAATSGLILWPYIVRGAWANLTLALSRLGAQDMISAQAVNVWWIFTWVVRVIDRVADLGWSQALSQQVQILAISVAQEVGYPNVRSVGLVMVGVAMAWAVWMTRRVSSVAGAFALAGWCAWAYVMLCTQVHENHLYLAVPLLGIGAGLEPRYRSAFCAVSVIATLNLYLFYGIVPGLETFVQRSWTFIDMTVLLSVVNVGAFAWYTRMLVAYTRINRVT